MARDIAVASIGNLMAPLAAFATAPILGHALGVEGRGEVAAVTAPYLLAVVAGTVGIPEALTFLLARRPAAARATFLRAVVLLAAAGGIAALVICFGAPVLSGGDQTVEHLMVLSAAAVVPAILVAGLRGVAAGVNRWHAITNERLIAALFRFVPIALLAVLGLLTPFSAFLVLVLSPLVGAVAYIRVLAVMRAGDAAEREPAPWSAMVSYGSRVWMGSLSGILLSRLDQVLMTSLSSTYQLGLYSTAVNISEVTFVLNTAIAAVMLTADAQNRDDAMITRGSRLATALAAGLAVVIGGSAPLWVGPLFGAGFEQSIPAALVLLGAVVIGTPGSMAGVALSARGRPELRSYSIILGLIANIVGVVVLVPTHGALGAASATLLGNAIAGGANLIWLQRLLGVRASAFVGLRRSDLVEIRRALSRFQGRLRRQR
ncbi:MULTISPECIES: oligosaccharide flippase family protein [unclassified Rathayibacter]|uniref:oligosaccharide flippase family protein n=1 Tax=unclassified Rathayibacter TaxID=2609250 RepID=UPI0006FBB3EA|nr:MULTISPECIES: oligosaccharide flippase family protein [unclassified Rathayibacter]KQQ00915.1 hypothetical protein ASF42_16560 [Rathayibacter sp. Leaf294]KQS10318.1 hypothetical protein ASG06_16560 [Rathayibacter sp. Leaf185]